MKENNINQNNKQLEGYISMLEEKTTDPKTRSLFECLLQQNSEKDDFVTRLQKKQDCSYQGEALNVPTVF